MSLYWFGLEKKGTALLCRQMGIRYFVVVVVLVSTLLPSLLAQQLVGLPSSLDFVVVFFVVLGRRNSFDEADVVGTSCTIVGVEAEANHAIVC